MAIVGTLPYTLANGATADAAQVMANYNYIVSQVNANAMPIGSIGVSIGTSLALGGATLGTNVLAATGAASFSSDINSATKHIVTAAHGATFALTTLEDLVTLSGATTNSNVQIPSGAVVFGCSNHVVTTITGSGGIASYSCGDSGSAARFGSGLGLTAGSDNIGNIGGQGYYSPTYVLFTPDAGSFSGGTVRLTVCYLMMTVPTT